MKQTKLLLLLLDQTDFLPANFFAKKLEVSNKTIYQYSNQMNEQLEKRKLRIKKTPRKGLLLEGKPEDKEKLRISLLQESKHPVSPYTPEYRRLYLFSRILFEKKLKTYQNYADDFFVSVQSIKNDFDRIIEYLRNNKVFIRRERHLLILEGDELEIEQCFKRYLELYQEKYSLTQAQKEKMFTLKIIKRVGDFVNEISVQSNRKHNDYLLNSLCYSFLIALNRLNAGCHFSEKENLLFNRLEVMQFYMVVFEFANEVNRQLRIPFINSDIYFLCSLLFAHAMEPVEKELENTDEIQKEVKGLIFEMSRLINCDLTEDHHLYQSLLSHIIPMLYRLHVGVRIKNPLRKEITEQYATMYTLVGYGIKNLAENFSVTLNKDEIAFLTIHFQLAFEKVETVKHLLVVCPSGLETSQLVLQKIKHSLPANNVIEITDLKKLEKVDLSKVDLLISTVELKDIALLNNIPLLYVSPLPSAKEIALINNKLQNIERHEKTFSPPSSEHKIIIERYLDQNLIFIHSGIKTVAQAFDFLSNQLEEKKIVTSDFKKAIYRREAMGTTALSTGVAIPHADPSTVLQTKIGIITLNKPILWGEINVELIILVAIREEDTAQAKDIIASIYELLTTTKRVQEIKNCQSISEIMIQMTKIS